MKKKRKNPQNKIQHDPETSLIDVWPKKKIKERQKIKSYTHSYFYGSTVNKSHFVEFGYLLLCKWINDIVQP